ncbi:hypothetical protein [Brevibacillus laterosporus]|uniref:hypothetical protein n=1 Tax=Brevibacillus laterosporus TaxID=1465 RepID=UPI00265321D8|nr:hypothetical protein [Brevibacillus laterosporus]MDN9008382.1 hypothetical protein [Brevibacillus laterosporus]MDO0939467.1 hypothetical protein [Brevibacillus laterosporus]
MFWQFIHKKLHTGMAFLHIQENHANHHALYRKWEGTYKHEDTTFCRILTASLPDTTAVF